MIVLDTPQIRALVAMPRLIDCLETAFRKTFTVPARQVEPMPGGAGGRLFFSMPAFDPDGGAVVKLATYVPENAHSSVPAIQAAIVVFDEAGTPTAMLDGTIVTQLRTGAASALASRYLSREDSAKLVVIGTGALAPNMALAHCAVRPIERIAICGRNADRAGATVEAVRGLIGPGIEVLVSNSVEDEVAGADIVCCATSSATPVVRGNWLRPGTFVDLVGNFSHDKREADDETVLRSRVFVDTMAGALAEAGELLIPIEAGIVTREHIEGDLAALASGQVMGRRNDREITLFKSVGTAIEDLAAARLIVAMACAR
jgi:ornithine cyclodeaminase